MAAERVRNTLPTYSLIPRAAQVVRRVGLTGSFLSFPAEIVRTVYHSINYALGDLRSANPRQRAMGAKRLAGLAAVAILPAAVSMMTRAMAGLDADDEKDIRRFLPEWSKNSDLYYTGNDGKGRIALIDASYLDPWNYLKKPVTAAMNGDNWQDALRDAALEAMEPFAGEGLVTKAVFDLARNRTEDGRKIFNPMAPFLDRTADQLTHAWRVFEPGAVTQARRISMAARGEQRDGRVYDLENEVGALLTGARRQDIDIADKLMQHAGRFVGERKGADLIYREVRDRRGTVTPEEIAEAKAKMEERRRELFDAMARDMQAARRLGVPQGVAVQSLMGAGLGERDTALVLTGRYLPYVDASPFSRQKLLREQVRNRQ